MILDIQHVVAGYGNYPVLKDVSLTADAGEMVVLIGPNGAGKSTVLKAIMGVCDRKGGNILFCGERIEHLPTYSIVEEGIGFVPQGRPIFPSMSVEENIMLGGYLLNHGPTRTANLKAVYERFPILFEKRNERAGALSGGQQQQLAIGRALMTSPKLLLLDEPTLGLSPKLMHELFQTLQGLRADGMALLIVEQNVRLALQYVDRGYLLANGQIRETGTPEYLGSDGVMRSAFLA